MEYDDIYLVPDGRSSVASRADVDLRSSLYGLYPIISSPMPGISGSALVAEMGRNNCLGILHRFGTKEERYAEMKEVARQGVFFGVAIKFGDTIDEFKEVELRLAKEAVRRGAVMIVVDVANGYLPQHEERGKILRGALPSTALASGNIVNHEGALYLRNCGFDYVRVGIGGGALCITRSVTGVGRGQLSALDDCSITNDLHIISDGGINDSGRAVQSFAFGAEFVMLGTLLAKAFEAEHDGEIFGAASKRNHLENGKDVKSIEGINIKMEKTMPLSVLLHDFLWGIRSAGTYLNICKYTDFPKASKYAAKEHL